MCHKGFWNIEVNPPALLFLSHLCFDDKARKVGAILKMLGVKTMSLGSWGRGIEFTAQFRRKVHALARQVGITVLDITNWMAVKGGYGGLHAICVWNST